MLRLKLSKDNEQNQEIIKNMEIRYSKFYFLTFALIGPILSKHNDIVLCLNEKMKITDIVKVTNKTRATIYKVKNILWNQPNY